MPLFFVIFIINFPAGVIVYWITTNTWTIAQQYFVKRAIGPPVPADDRAAAVGGGGGRGGGGGADGDGGGRTGRAASAGPLRSGGGLARCRGRRRRGEPVSSASGSRGRGRHRPGRRARRRSAPGTPVADGGAMSEAADRVQELLERIAADSGVEAEVRSTRTRTASTGRVRRRRPRPADRASRPDDRRDPAPRLPDRLPGRGAASGSSSTPPAIASDGPWRCGPPPTRRPRPPSMTVAPVALEAMSALERKVVHEHLKVTPRRRDVQRGPGARAPSGRRAARSLSSGIDLRTALSVWQGPSLSDHSSAFCTRPARPATRSRPDRRRFTFFTPVKQSECGGL